MRAGLGALLALVAVLAFPATASAGWDDPVGTKKPVLVIPIRYGDFKLPCSPTPCPASFFDSSFLAASGSINPPYRTGPLWGTFLNDGPDAHVLEDSYGKTSFDFRMVVNPGSKDGWWDAGQSIEAYGRLASAIFPIDTDTGLPPPLDDFVKRLPCSIFTSTPIHRLLFIDNLSIGGGLRGRQTITLQCGKTWVVDWTWLHQGGNEAGFSVFLFRALGLSLGMRDLGRPCPAYPLRATCFERWDATAAAGRSEYSGLQRLTLGWVPSSSVKIPTPPVTKGTTIELQPLDAALSSSTPTLAQLPLITGPMFKGYLLECRRGTFVEKAGVLVTWVDEVAGQSWVASKPPLSIDLAALAPGEAYIDSKNDIEIRALTSSGSHCQAAVSKAPVFYSGVVIRLPIDAFGSPDFLSPDIGFGRPGDLLQAPWAGHLTPVFFTLANGGGAPSQGGVAAVDIQNPATVAVACGSPPAGDSQSLPLPVIPAGQSYTASLSWPAGKPTASPVRITVRLQAGPGDISGGGSSSSVFAVQAHKAGETTPVRTAFIVAASGRCKGTMVLRSTPLHVPTGWSARVSPRFLRLRPGQSRVLTALVLAPRNATLGAQARIPIAVFANGLRDRPKGRRPLQPRPAGGFDLLARLVGPGSASLACPALGQTGAALTISGSVPGAGPVLIEYRTPTGTPSVRELTAGTNGAYADTFVPSTTGTWHVQARFQGDAAHGPAESPECAFQVTTPPAPPPQLPDLVISSLKRGSVTVSNQGQGAAGPFTVSVKQSQGGTLHFDIAGLGAGESATRSFTCLQGELSATADSGNSVAESDESNNKDSTVVQTCQ
jgi:hypothetical protein